LQLLYAARKGAALSTHNLNSVPHSSTFTKHDEAVAVEGLEDLFKWASEMVSEGEDFRMMRAREQRIRRQALDIVQRLREQKATARATEEIAYLQRRVIALIQRLQDLTEENCLLKQVMVAQAYVLQTIPQLENEIGRLKNIALRISDYQKEQQELLTALSRLKKDRDFLDELLQSNEQENTRLSGMLLDARAKIELLESRRWWHWFWPPKN
jgi:hypothetical protein